MLCQEMQMKVVVVRGLERVWEPLASTLARVTSNLASKSISERYVNSYFLSKAGICIHIHANFFNFYFLLLIISSSLANWRVDT